MLYGEIIKSLRKKANMTQKELATKLNFKSASAVGMIEREEREVSLETIKLLSEIFGVSTDHIIGMDSYDDYIPKHFNGDIDEYEAFKKAVDDDAFREIGGNFTKENKIFLDTIPTEFTDPILARTYVDKHQIFGAHGFDPDKLDDEEILEFANELLRQMEIISYKYKK